MDATLLTNNSQHCWMLHVASVSTSCCILLDVVGQSLKPVKLFSHQLPTFLLFRDRRSVAQQCWIPLHSSSNIAGATYAHTHGLQRLMGFILPTMHCRSQYCWELLCPFAHSLTIQMKTLQWYIHVVLFTLYVVLTFESLEEILWCYHSNETSSVVLSRGTIYLVCSSNF